MVNRELELYYEARSLGGLLFYFSPTVKDFFSWEGAIECRLPNDVIKTFYLPINSKLKEIIDQYIEFLRSKEEVFIHPNIFLHELGLDLSTTNPSELDDILDKYATSIKHAIGRTNLDRPQAFQRKLTDKKSKPITDKKSELSDFHFIEEPEEGFGRANLSAPFTSEENKLPFEEYGLYKQEEHLNKLLRYVYIWRKSSYGGHKSLIDLREAFDAAIMDMRETVPKSYYKFNFNLGLVLSWEHYAKFDYKKGNRFNFLKFKSGRDGKIYHLPTPKTKSEFYNAGLSLINFPQIDPSGKIVEPNKQDIYKTLEFINTGIFEFIDKNGEEAYQSLYGYYNYSHSCHHFIPYSLLPTLKNIARYRWIKFHLDVLEYLKNK